ncbi:MAG: InlB B-repeat-containing protein [Spirochaetaceae bacterium]|jgi:hypothetical protein|nr:InlB B-repeat-containing protein [Spirochaetaceae bacterium]
MDVYGVWQNRPAGSYRVTFKNHYEAGSAISTTYTGEEDDYKVSALPGDEYVKRDHYIRKGADWYYTPEKEGNAGSETKFDTGTVVEQDIIVYAKWTGETYTVTFKSRTGQAQPQTTTYNYPDNDPAKLLASQIPPAPSDKSPHYIYDTGWYIQGGEEFTENTVITGNITVTPKWAGNTYTVTFEGGGGTPSKTSAQVTYSNNDTREETTMSLVDDIAAASRAGCTFDGWRTTDDKTFDKDTTVTTDITITAQWTFTGYKLTFDGDDATTEAEPAEIVVGAGGDPAGAKAQLPTPNRKRTTVCLPGVTPNRVEPAGSRLPQLPP